MKKILLSIILSYTTVLLFAQTYPDPEFSNEICYLKKDSVYTVLRLEKGTSKMETKTKMGGFGGSESSYSIDGEKSTIRFSKDVHFSFILSTGPSSSHKSDSMMQANGMDPSMTQGMSSMLDPLNTVTLYKLDAAKGERKIIMQKNGAALPFSSHKSHSSDQYTFSVKKIREGYWELVVDKSLPKGEYAFTFRNLMAGQVNPMGETLLFLFGVD